MTVGNRDTFIIVESRTFAQDPVYGSQANSPWATEADMWAEVQDVLPTRSESVGGGVSMQRRPARVRVDYLDGLGITSDMRIDIDGRKLQIISGPAHKRDTSEWEFVAEEVSTQGEAP